MLSLFAFLLVSPDAFAVETDITLCVKIHTLFTDPGGDFWAANGNREARGVRYHITDDTHLGQSGFLDEDGCKELTISVTSTYGVTVWSEAQVNGIDLVSYQVDCASYDAEGECLVDTEEETAIHTVMSIPRANTTPLIIVSGDQTWYNLAVGMFAMHRSDMNLGTYSARGCCLTSYGDDGTCTVGLPYSEWDGATEILFFNKVWDHAKCCSSDFQPSWSSSLIPGVDVNNPWKFVIAHELGHTIVMERMGKRTATDYTAPLNSCMGCYQPGTEDAPFDKSDPASWAGDHPGAKEKCILSKEYQSGAAREGWASFYSSWLWNYQTQSDCFYNSHTIHDFDLDGDIDDNYVLDSGPADTDWYNEPDTYDGAYNCEGAPVADVPQQPIPTSDSLESYIDAKDWLEDAIDEGVCSGTMVNRGTQYDWHRFFWDMLTDWDVPIEDLADIYVDMCPTNWIDGEQDTGESDEGLPTERLETSCDFHGHGYAWLQERNNGQDH